MTFQRESVFHCVFSTPSAERLGHVRAWDAEEAAQLFRAELRYEGVSESGTIRVFATGEQPESAGDPA